MKKLHSSVAVIAACAMLAACGNTVGDRAISGAGIGAGVGAVAGTMIGGDPITGAAIGGAVGAAAGGLTKSKNVNLGKPIWR
jgi:osmotically inducible lipoprotein OsmB